MTRDTLDPPNLHGLTPDQAAARWLAREDLDRSPQREQFEQWLAQSPDHEAAWTRAEQVWSAFDEAEADDLIAAMARAARRSSPEVPQILTWPRLAAACLLVVVVSAGLAVGLQGQSLLFFKPSGHSGTGAGVAAVASLHAVGPADYVTGPGQKSVVDLPDGTRMTLDADSAVDVAYGAATRDVRLLHGHAFFDVAHDKAHPFKVEAAQRIVTALGTEFDVRLAPGGIRVVLAQGRVSVTSTPDGPKAAVALLSPGQLFAAQTGAAGAVTAADLTSELAWKEGVLEFKDAPLSEVIVMLNRYTRAQIVIRDAKVGAMRVTGVFRSGDVGQFGRSIHQVLPVKLVARDADTYELVATRR